MPIREQDPQDRATREEASRLRKPGSPAESAGAEPAKPQTTPPPESRTDWDRGVGELGTEELDSSQPLNAPVKRPPDEETGKPQ